MPAQSHRSISAWASSPLVTANPQTWARRMMRRDPGGVPEEGVRGGGDGWEA